MKPLSCALLGLACGFAPVQPALAQTDFLTAPKVACTPDSVTRCSAPDKCTTRPAGAQDKGEILVIDFAGKKFSIRKGGDATPAGDVVEEQASSDLRRFALAATGSTGPSATLAATLSKAGKLTLLIGKEGSKAEAICAPES